MRMSPISAPEPCPHIVTSGDFVFCAKYENRPKECETHRFPASVCPVGADILGIEDSDGMRLRVDRGYELSLSL